MQHTETYCKACSHLFTGSYCNKCGEKVYKESDKSVMHFVSEGVHFLTHFEGTLFTTLRYLFTQPGKLSELYCAGIRKSLFKPLSLFFLLVIVYLLFPVFEGLSMKLYYYMQNDLYGEYASRKITDLMQARGWSEVQVSEAFAQKSVKVSKFLLMILIPLTALFCWLLTFRKRNYFFDQMVFATEINCVYLIWGFMLLPLLVFLFQIIARAVTGSVPGITDKHIGPIMYAVLIIYITLAAKRFYLLKPLQSAGFALLTCVAHIVIVHWIYKFLLFSIITMML